MKKLSLVAPAEVDGALKTTCKEAMIMLNQGKARKAWFRPYNQIDRGDPDNDLAFVWKIDEKE
jgi:hypothetical protein